MPAFTTSWTYAPVVLSEKAALQSAVVVKQAAALDEIGSLAEDEVGEIVSGDGASESKKAGLKEGVLYRSAQVIYVPAEVKFMAATAEGDDFPDLPVAAIKLTGMAGVDIEKTIDVDAFHGGRARRRGDIHAGILKGDWRAGK